MLHIHHFLRGPLGNNMFLLVDEATSRAAVVDPGIDSEDMLAFAQQHGWKIELIINTHAHFDHVWGNAWFTAQTGAPIALHPADLPLLRNLQATCLNWGIPAPDASPEPAIELKHGQVLEVFGHALEIRHTPGHSPGQVALLIKAGEGIVRAELDSHRFGGYSKSEGRKVGRSDVENGNISDNGLAVEDFRSSELPAIQKGSETSETAGGDKLRPYAPIQPIALVGDTLFNRGVGRWDLPGASWDELERSIREQLYTLPDDTLVLPGHMEFTTIGEEKRFNPYVGDGARFMPKV
jgi:glyoxylase-like metal-dependent hydrolase (beta-lactamase superfamily II)